jgi:carboxyl-terminal processing protease
MDDKQLESIDLNDEKMKDFQEGNIEIASSESGEEKESGKARGIMLFLIGLFAGIGVTMILCIFLILIPWSKEKKAAEAEKTALEEPLSYNRKVNTLKSILKQYYYEDVPEEDIEESIYKGIIKATGDRYSEYYSAEERKIANEDWEGKFYGIGAVLYYDDEARYTRIESVEDGSPAKEAGLEADDYIIEVDGTDIEGMPVSDVVRLVRGEEGTDVKLGIIRGKEYKEYTITRGEIKQTTVAYEKMDDGVAYIAIGSFSDTTVESFAEAIQQAKDDGAKGVIFDIRGNGGGGLDVCVAMCQQFLPAGLIVYTQDKYGQKEEFYSDGTNEWDIPMVVLVNGGSASASEIFTAALKDMGVAKIVGTKTYGKGVYQVVVPLKDESAVKVTNGRFYSPKGECFHEVGIEPDVEAKLDVDAYYKDGTDSQLDEAINVLREEMGLERIEKEVTSEETSEGTSEEESEKTSEK